MSDEIINIVPMDSIQLDENNANQHTERGTYMLKRSVEEFSILTAGTLDKNNVVIVGNNRTKAYRDVLDASEAIVIETDGTKPIYIKRTDLDATEVHTMEAAIVDNRTAQVGINFDVSKLEFVQEELEIDLGEWFSEGEIDSYLIADDEDWEGAFESLPEGEKSPFQQITFTLHDDQAVQVRDALKIAKSAGSFGGENENSNGNALSRICETYITNYDNG